MHDIKWIRDNPDAFDRGLARRGLAGEAKRLIAIDERRRAAIQKAEAALARRNAASKEIGAAKKSNEEARRAEALMAEVARLKTEIPALEAEEKKLSKELDDALAQIPNLPLEPKCPTARTRTTMSSTIISGRSAITASRPSSISIWARRSARWISRPRRSFPARALSC